MATLVIDTTFGLCTASVVDSNKNCYISNNSLDQKQSESIVKVVKRSLEKSQLDINNIENLIVTNGPGNFTSIRVGVSFALGIAKGISAPLYSLSSLEFLSFFDESTKFSDKKFITLIPSRGNEFFLQVFDNLGKNLSDIKKKEKKEIENCFSPSEFVIVKSVFHKSNFGFKEKYEILEKDFEEVSIILASKIKKKNNKLRELNDINYFSQPAAEKVNNSWYMKKKK